MNPQRFLHFKPAGDIPPRASEIIGTYEPRIEPSLIKIDNDRALHWLKNGAQPTERVEKLLKISGAWDVFQSTKKK